MFNEFFRVSRVRCEVLTERCVHMSTQYEYDSSQQQCNLRTVHVRVPLLL